MIVVNCECGEGSATFFNITMETGEFNEFEQACDICGNLIKIKVETSMV